MKKLIALCVACLLGPYLLAAFVLWEANPGAWAIDARVIVAGMVVGGFLFGSLEIGDLKI